MSRSDIVRRLRDLGFEGPISKGTRANHPDVMVRGDNTITLPNDHGKDIGVPLLSRLLRQWQIERDEWLG